MWVYNLWKSIHCAIHIWFQYFSTNLLYCLDEVSNLKVSATPKQKSPDIFFKESHINEVEQYTLFCFLFLFFSGPSWSLERVEERINTLLRRQAGVGSSPR